MSETALSNCPETSLTLRIHFCCAVHTMLFYAHSLPTLYPSPQAVVLVLRFPAQDMKCSFPERSLHILKGILMNVTLLSHISSHFIVDTHTSPLCLTSIPARTVREAC